MDLTTGSRLGPYEIVSRIGAGGMGEVFRARDTRLDRSVAIKVLSREFAENAQLKLRFEREAKTISQLSHPHICTLHDIGHIDGVDYLVMEFLEGETLADRLVRGPLPLAEVLRVGAQIAQALDRAHRAGIVHRDLKPGNIMITKSGAKLLDFGLARSSSSSAITTDATQHKPLTEEGMILGTWQYMAPEQLAGEEADARSDIFAFGAVLYEMLTGARAFEGKTKTSLIAAIIGREPRPASQLQPLTPAALEHVITKCLAKERDERWQSAADIASELEWIRGSSQTATSRGRAWIRPGVSIAIVAALIVAAAVIATRFARRQSVPLQTFHAELLLAPGDTLAPVGYGSIALSPDATRLAMVLGRPAETTVIAIRDLASAATTKLAGTEGATFPFWSPDGTRLGFFADGKLKTIGAAGTGVQLLCDGREGRGGAWSPEGVIVFSPAILGPLYKIGEGGGTPVAITHPPAGWTHRGPLFLPDGKTVLFVGKAKSSSPSDLYSGSVDATREKRVLENASNPSYADGRLLFVRNENLFAQRFDPHRLTVSGTPVAIADHVEYQTGFGFANFSGSRAALVYVPTARTPRQTVVYDRAGTATPIGAPPAHDRVLDVSPDGRRVAVLTSEWKDADISLIDMDRASRSRLTFRHGVSATAAFSPDGKQVACSTFDGAGTKIFLQSLGGNTSEPILEVPTWLQIDGWSADGRDLLISIPNKETAFDAGFIDIANRKVVLLTHGPANEELPTLSPNQKWFAYASDESGARQIYLTRFPSGTGKWQATVDGGAHPRWSRDGKELFYVYQNRLHSVAFKETSGPEFGQPKVLFTMPMDVEGVNGSGYAVTPGGRFVTVRPIAEAPPRTVHLITSWTKLLPQE